MGALSRWSKTRKPKDKAELDALMADTRDDGGGEAE